MTKERRLLIDDTRTEEDKEVSCSLSIIARNYWEGLRQLLYNGPWDIVFLDHDLNSFEDSSNGKSEKTGYDIICRLEDHEREVKTQCPYGSQFDDEILTSALPGKIICVSSNAPGRKRIQQAIDKLYNLGD